MKCNMKGIKAELHNKLKKIKIINKENYFRIIKISYLYHTLPISVKINYCLLESSTIVKIL